MDGVRLNNHRAFTQEASVDGGLVVFGLMLLPIKPIQSFWF